MILFIALFFLVVLFLKLNFSEFLLFVFKLVLKTLCRLRGREVVTLGGGCYFSRLFGNPLIQDLDFIGPLRFFGLAFRGRLNLTAFLNLLPLIDANHDFPSL